MISLIGSEHSKGFPVYVGVVKSPGFDDGPDVVAFGLELALQYSRDSPLGDLLQTLRSIPSVLPYSIR